MSYPSALSARPPRAVGLLGGGPEVGERRGGGGRRRLGVDPPDKIPFSGDGAHALTQDRKV